MPKRQARGAISTSHHRATEAGAAALERGGNAIDAALAAAAALCVVYPNNVALGGDLVALVRSPDGKVHFLNATGVAPEKETLGRLRGVYGTNLPRRGVDTITLPGGVRGWEELHRLGANRDWSEHFQAAIEFARDGVPLARSVARALIDEREDLEQDSGSRELFYPEGVPIAEGESFAQPALATSLGEIANEGADAFYTGDLASRWISGLERLGSKLSVNDASIYKAEWKDPLAGDFRGYRVLTSPPNTQGFSLLRALAAVEGGSIEYPFGTGAGALAKVFQQNNGIRDTMLADPEFGGMSGEGLLGFSGHPLNDAPHDGIPTGDTVGLSTISSDGWAVSLINSIYFGFGSCVLEPETGILFQNRGTSFSLDPESPNAFAPGKRPRHTLMPVLVLKDDVVAWVSATMGGQAQPQIHAHLLLHAMEGGHPHDATHAPRWVVGRQDTDDSDGTVTVETGVSDEAIASLAAAGMLIKPVDYPSELLGHSNLIIVTSDGYAAASDPRSDGSAIVVA